MAVNTIPRSFQAWANISATPPDFYLDAGLYGLLLTATWGGGTAVLQKLLPDGATWAPVSSQNANSYATLYLPAGKYRLVITTATALYGEIALIVRGAFR